MLKKSILVFVVIAILGTLVVGCSTLQDKTTEEQDEAKQNRQTQNSQEAKKTFSRSDNGEGGIQVEATWGTKEYYEATGDEQSINSLDLDNKLIFEISMSAHSGDLRTYPISDSAELVIDDMVFKAEEWEFLSKEIHHISGVLTFSAKDELGESLVKDSSKIELNLKDLGNVPNRYFKWTIGE